MGPARTTTVARASLRDTWSPTLAAAQPWWPPPRRTIVVAPHPDDESLSSGGLIALQRRRGLDVIVVAVTDGEASYDRKGDASLGTRRCAEQRSALEVLGVDGGSIERVGVADGRVATLEDLVCRHLVDLLHPDDLLVAPWDRDVHPDHEACGRAALNAARVVPVELVFSLFWAWHHRLEDEIDRTQLVALELGETALAQKQRAIGQHESQFRTDSGDDPILDEHVAEPASWRSEYFLRARTGDRS